jgi:hypothetical protein
MDTLLFALVKVSRNRAEYYCRGRQAVKASVAGSTFNVSVPF